MERFLPTQNDMKERPLRMIYRGGRGRLACDQRVNRTIVHDGPHRVNLTTSAHTFGRSNETLVVTVRSKRSVSLWDKKVKCCDQDTLSWRQSVRLSVH